MKIVRWEYIIQKMQRESEIVCPLINRVCKDVNTLKCTSASCPGLIRTYNRALAVDGRQSISSSRRPSRPSREKQTR